MKKNKKQNAKRLMQKIYILLKVKHNEGVFTLFITERIKGKLICTNNMFKTKPKIK